MGRGFDRHARAQGSAGLANPCVFRSSDDKNEVVILFDTEDSKKAKDLSLRATSRTVESNGNGLDRNVDMRRVSKFAGAKCTGAYITLSGAHLKPTRTSPSRTPTAAAVRAGNDF
jgi:hypothetical protein